MSKQKKQFPSVHQGLGQSYDRCEQEQSQLSERQQKRQAWKASFDNDPIDLRSLPKRVVLKSRDIIKRLKQCQDYRQFRGKRLRHDRHVISIPVTRDYRLLCRMQDNGIAPEAVVSHQDYNVCKPGS
ncbi:hypothetical protein KR51_00010690 [Rubidibacter lacunae KORDI 51-2]|uniref:Uncharacterized protein n=1 Tax=Rubidibacter lacunae KORDI 51-2 TaxID=582515 RepID=U5DNS8_9CHRO|nr:hypothetical protein [Rubidibacter lacunae]ERN42259.1 hypothetical protein KR51_00010690 [Rubidibacter lacunae KORDI 51-2]